MAMRERLRFRADATEEILDGGKYTLRYQTIDDRKHPDEIKAEGESWPLLVEVLDNGVLTYERNYGFRDNTEFRMILEGMRREIELGMHASRETRKTN